MIGTNRAARESRRLLRRAVPLALLGAFLVSSTARGQGNPPPDEATRRRRAAAAAERGAFEVRPSNDPDLLRAYERLSESRRPLFVTTDLVLHGTHRVVDAAIASIEEEAMLPAFEEAVSALLDGAVFDAKNLKGTRRRAAAAWNAGFLAVARALFRGEPVEEARIAPFEGGAVLAAAKAEHALVLAHEGIHLSPLFGESPLRSSAGPNGEDYSAYLPRGHYTRNERLTRYFLGRLYLARTAFPLPDSGSAPTEADLRVIRQTLNMGSLAATRPEFVGPWREAKRLDLFFGGEPDDVQPDDVIGLWSRYRTLREKRMRAETEREAEDDESLVEFAEFIRRERGARIREGYVDGLRVLGASAPWDLVAFERLTRGPERTLPKGLDVMALLGSAEARARLEKEGDLGQSWYWEAFDSLAKESPAPSVEKDRRGPQGPWTVARLWLRAIARLFEASPDAAPAFLRDPGWRWKDLVSGSASWAELRHDTILYAKQPITPGWGNVIGLHGGTEEGPPSAYLEPRPDLYVDLANLARRLDEVVRASTRPLPRASDATAALVRALDPLARVARGEMAGDTLSDADRSHLIGLAATFRDIERRLLPDVESPKGPIIADVFGDYSGGAPRFLLVGTDAPRAIVVTVRGGEPAYEGAIATYHEFASPERLTDEAWRSRLAHSTAPPLPAWEAEWFERAR